MTGEIENLVKALLVVSIIVTGVALFVGGAAEPCGGTGSCYGVENVTQATELSSFTAMNDTREMSLDMYESLNQTRILNIPYSDVFMSLISGGWSAVRLLASSVGIVGNLATDLARYASVLNLGWVVPYIMALVAATLAFAILYLIFKVRA
jgi:hypothetical protein